MATPARLWYQSRVFNKFNKEERPPMKKPHKIVSGASTPNSRELAHWLAKDGQLLITIEAGTRVLKEVAERDLSELDVLVVYLDGIVFGDYHVLAAVGVDA